MPPNVRIELDPTTIEIEPGGPPGEATVTLQNLGDAVEQYAVEVTGLDAAWYTASVAGVVLFPQDRDQVRLTFHPPAQAVPRAGTYPFRVVVRTGTEAPATTIEGALNVQIRADFRVDLQPLEQAGRWRGTFRVQIANRGAVELGVALEAHVTLDACHLRLAPESSAVVAAGATTALSLAVTPKRERWVGPERTYDFTVTARPREARGEPQTVSGRYTHRPWLKSWAPLRQAQQRAARPVLIGVGVLLVIVLALWWNVPGRVVDAAQAVGGATGRTVGATAAWVGSLIPGRGKAPSLKPGACNLDDRFVGFFPSEAPLIGECATGATPDPLGNAQQLTTRGVLYWLKESDTVYFFAGENVYVLIDGRLRRLRGSGQP
jgi:hypothetical protein